MRENSFFRRDKAILTAMLHADTPDRVITLMDKAVPQGAEAFGIQSEQLKPAFQNDNVYRRLFSHAGDRPVYVTHYRYAHNEGKSDERLAREMLDIAACGADLCDVMGDYFDPTPGELTDNPTAVARQRTLIESLHARGAKVLMSSHIQAFTPEEEVLRVALAHQARGADISKIVVNAKNQQEEAENLHLITRLKETLSLPFLLLSGGECHLLRRIGGELGCCMYLCVPEHNAVATPLQPLLSQVKALRDTLSAD